MTDHTSPDLPKLLTTKQLAEIFGVSAAAIRKRIRLGQLGPVIKGAGKGYRMRAEALQRFLEGKEERWRRESA